MMPAVTLILSIASVAQAPATHTASTATTAIATPTKSPPEIKAPTHRVVVYTLASTEKLAGAAKQLTDSILLRAGKQPRTIAIGQSEIQILASHAKDRSDVLDCKAEECLLKLAQSVEAEELITGHLGAWGEGYLVTLKLSDAKRGTVERGESASAEKLEELERETLLALDRLLGVQEPAAGRFALPHGPDKTIKIAVIELAAYDTREELARNLTELLALELRKVEGVSVISQDEIKTMLRYEAQKQVVQCKNDIACLIEIGGALGVEYLVAGGIGKLQDTWIIHLKLMDIAHAEVAHRISESVRAPERHLAQAMRFAAWNLLGTPAEGAGSVVVAVEVDEGQGSIDGGSPFRIAPKQERPGLVAGKHALTLTAEGYEPFQQEFYVEKGQLTTLRPELTPIPTPWYKQWWVWTIVGAVAAVGTTSVIIATHRPSDGTVNVSFP